MKVTIIDHYDHYSNYQIKIKDDNQDFVEDAKLPGFMNQYYSSIGV